ncbi:anthrone oxygenase family protein [Ruania rhizosphaerae]|uniref:anthrone oxygenase family protein n=1 Tax=Ruania rhizosphaerae TaxID=1840413 RepID=UPI00135BFE05|nr:anthrone oxygenase family protein [Ruania rhizosphaerae]
MDIVQVLLIIALVTTGLSAGVFFTFTTLIVPGLRDAPARESLAGFQTIDRRLQPTAPSVDWQPVFGVVVFGTSILLPVVFVVSLSSLSTTSSVLLAAAALLYAAGFWLPTLTVILPFNNRVRDMRLEDASAEAIAAMRAEFDRVWVGWNLVRTVASTLSLVLLAIAAVA